MSATNVLYAHPRHEWFLPGASADGMCRKTLRGFDEGNDHPLPGVTTCIIGMYDEKYDPIAAIAEPNWLAYCERHNYALRTYPGMFHTDPSRPETYGDKIRFSLYYDVRGMFETVVLLDIDSLFINMEKPLPKPGIGGMLWTYSDSGPMSGLLILRTDDDTERRLRYIYEYAAANNHVRHGKIEPGGISDQDAMRDLMYVPPFRTLLGDCLEAKVFGFCFPESMEGGYEPRIMTCRGGSIEEKLAVMRKWAPALGNLPPTGELAPTLTERAFPANPADDLLPATTTAPDAPSPMVPFHAVDAYNPRLDFDRNWVGPPEALPRGKDTYRSQAEKDIWYGCVVENEYRIDSFKPSDVIIDIGAHIGSFSWLAYQRGSRSVYAFEIDPWHYEGAKANLAACADGVALHHAAVVRGDAARAREYHYGGNWNSFDPTGTKVESTSLDEIIAQVCDPGGFVRFMKMDCEGGEWPILYTCQSIDRILQIAGEYHLVAPEGRPELEGLPHPITTEALKYFLELKGFEVSIEPHAENTGNFFATRVRRVKSLVPAGGAPFFGKIE